jgi:hypothetical protein
LTAFEAFARNEGLEAHAPFASVHSRNYNRWRDQRFVVVDYGGMDTILARESGKRRLRRIPLNEALVDLAPGDRNAWTPDLVSVREEAWRIPVKRFKILKPLSGFISPAGSCAKQTSIRGSLGTLVL